MKDFSYETEFVKYYIRKERRERLLFELTNEKKRQEGLDRFCHECDTLLDKRKIVLSANDLRRQADFEKYTKGHDETCIILSPDPSLDGLKMSLKEALERNKLSFDASIILGKDICIVRSEAMKQTMEYLLIKETE